MEWVRVISSVLQGLVLEGILFNIFIDDIDTVVINALIKKFADNTKVAMVVENKDDAQRMQTNINMLWQWAVKWKMAFNPKKCKVMHLDVVI